MTVFSDVCSEKKTAKLSWLTAKRPLKKREKGNPKPIANISICNTISEQFVEEEVNSVQKWETAPSLETKKKYTSLPFFFLFRRLTTDFFPSVPSGYPFFLERQKCPVSFLSLSLSVQKMDVWINVICTVRVKMFPMFGPFPSPLHRPSSSLSLREKRSHL